MATLRFDYDFKAIDGESNELFSAYKEDILPFRGLLLIHLHSFFYSLMKFIVQCSDARPSYDALQVTSFKRKS
jgi:hypothetical protein